MTDENEAGVTGDDEQDEMSEEERKALEGAGKFVANIRQGHADTGQGDTVILSWYLRGVAGGLSALYHLAKRAGSLPSPMHDELKKLHTELGHVLGEVKRGKRG